MVEIDEEKLQDLMTAVIKEHPDLDAYLIWMLSVNFLLNEQGIFGDEETAQLIREQRMKQSGFNIRVV